MAQSELNRLKWDAIDVLLVSGDAYVDHPTFGVPLLGRWLVAHGFRIGIIAQPRWDRPDDILRLGRPRLCAGITSGSLDSMLAHYTAFRKQRSDDAYTPGGLAGQRPNRAVIVYSNLVRQAFPGLPLVLGGIEASMRRVSHYDFWTDALRHSILLDSKADLLAYGMAEQSLLEAVQRLDQAAPGQPPADALAGISGTVRCATARTPIPAATVPLPAHEAIRQDPFQLVTATLAIEAQIHRGGPVLTQQDGIRTLVIEPPADPLDQTVLDGLYELPFTRLPHPSYQQPVPALEPVRFTVTTHRGCAGGCTFCALALHQGRRIQSRSVPGILREVRDMHRLTGWNGILNNVGGPTANFWGARCTAPTSSCRRTSCLWPAPCPHFKTDQVGLAALLRKLAALPGMRQVRSASGIRTDAALREPAYLDALLRDFVGGQLTVAPEHRSPRVLDLMRKPSFEGFEEFVRCFEAAGKRSGREQYIVPYLMSAFPGCTDRDMRELAAWFRQRGWKPRQVQCFIPTPGTVATAMYWSGKAPDGTPIHVARSDAERLRQHGLLIDSPAPPSRGTVNRRRRSAP